MTDVCEEKAKKVISGIEISDYDLKCKIKIDDDLKDFVRSSCASAEIHSILLVTYKDIFQAVMTWILQRPYAEYVELMKILNTNIRESVGKCFTGKISRLVSTLDGFHPNVRINISNAEQTSNRVLMLLIKLRDESPEVKMEAVKKELKELEMPDDEIEKWIEGIDFDHKY